MFLSSVRTIAFSQSIIEIEIKWKNVYTTTTEDITAKRFRVLLYRILYKIYINLIFVRENLNIYV